MKAVLRRYVHRDGDPIPDLSNALHTQDNGSELVYWAEEKYPTEQCSQSQASYTTAKRGRGPDDIIISRCILLEMHSGGCFLIPMENPDPWTLSMYRRLW